MSNSDDVKAGIIVGAIILGTVGAIVAHDYSKKREEELEREADALLFAEEQQASAPSAEPAKPMYIDCADHKRQMRCTECGECVTCRGGFSEYTATWCTECEKAWDYNNNDSD
jgi:hypothetical protein